LREHRRTQQKDEDHQKRDEGRMRKERAESAPAKHGETNEERALDDGNQGHQKMFAEHDPPNFNLNPAVEQRDHGPG
jgi:hypothetical protein